MRQRWPGSLKKKQAFVPWPQPGKKEPTIVSKTWAGNPGSGSNRNLSLPLLGPSATGPNLRDPDVSGQSGQRKSTQGDSVLRDSDMTGRFLRLGAWCP